ncbi:MAG: DUF2278 family protein [Ectobacillus sp.]
MPLGAYGVFKGRVLEGLCGTGKHPHYQIHALAGKEHYRIAVNVQSQEAPSELLYTIVNRFEHPITSKLLAVSEGFTSIESKPGSLALDYVRGKLFNRNKMRPLAHDIPGEDNDLNEKIDMYVKKAASASGAFLYAFGEFWGPRNRKDAYFQFAPEKGLHNIHMNQGNSPKWRTDNGVWQDGALFFYFPYEQRWTAVFLAFQSQTWHTDDALGRPIFRNIEANKRRFNFK